MHGRNDGLIPVSFTSRPYFGQNRIVEGAASKLSYIEVTNAQHFDAFIDNAALPGYDSMFVPLHYYYVQAMDRMWAHLTLNARFVRRRCCARSRGDARRVSRRRLPRQRATLSNTEGADQITFSNNTASDSGTDDAAAVERTGRVHPSSMYGSLHANDASHRISSPARCRLEVSRPSA